MAIFLESARMIFRDHQASDLEAWCAMQMDAEFRRYVGGKPRTREASETRFWTTYHAKPMDELALYATELKDTQAYIGYCGIYPHFASNGDIIPHEGTLAFYLGQEYWGKGLATEAAKAFLEWGFEQKQLQKVIGTTEVEHKASRRILEKLGFRLVRIEEGRRSFCYYELARENYSK